MFKQLFCMATLLVTISGCQSQLPAPSHLNLDGNWQVSKIANQAVKPYSPVLFDFDNGNFSGSNGCNNFKGQYMQYNNELSLSANSTTMKACVDGLVKQEQSFLQHLVQVTSFKIKGNKLKLMGVKNNVLFELTHYE
ncbi:META domain-containing protein [Shewanella intestini]|uniref:META domain-containing protein n=1 Tax=Shewanella intestini TaxID=2017544 RepID=A0ABS5I7S9_9GAMM|nr:MULTISPECIES: META domain-containing protein [Shewanella]MBR9729400.1 META domain-containing protein [Shewanella intestini]MRG37480.1 META domain-containing protein [Shewanella sp. XMDDZSB0408]